MIKLRLVSVLLFFNTSQAADAVAFDRSLASDLSIAYLRAYFRMSPNSAPPYDLEYSNPILASAIDGQGRKFVFVAYKNKGEKAGASMRLEVCGSMIDLQPSWYGGSLDVDKDLKEFQSMSGDKTADYPGACYVSVRPSHLPST